MKKPFTLFTKKALFKLLGVLTVLVQCTFFNAAHGQTLNQPFTPGNIVVYRVGTGTGTLTSVSTAVFLDEYAPTGGSPVNIVALPTLKSGNNFPFSSSGTAASEGGLQLSLNGQYLTASGYSATPGLAGISGTSAVLIPRVVAVIKADATISTATALRNWSTANNPRGAVSSDGTQAWVCGAAGGVIYTPVTAFNAAGDTASTSGTVVSGDVTTGVAFANGERISVFEDQLYVSTQKLSENLFAVGSGLPNTAGGSTLNMTTLPGLETGGTPQSFFFADLTGTVTGVDVLYITDNGTGKIFKYSLPTTGGTWTLSGTYTGITGVAGLTGSVLNGGVTLYASSPTGIFKISDTGGWSHAPSAPLSGFTAIITPAANTALKDVAFVPVAAGAPTQVNVTAINNSQPITAGIPFNITVQAQDNSGNKQPVTSSVGITLQVNSGSGSVVINGGPINLTPTDNLDEVTFSATYTNTSPTNHAESGVSFTAIPSSPSLNSNFSGFVQVLAPANALVFGTVPSTGTINSPLDTVKVIPVNAGVTDVNYTGAITLAQASGPGITSGTLTVNAANGVAAFGNVQMSATGSYTLTATATGLTSAPASSSITIQSGSLSFVGFPTTGVANNPLTSFTVQALNADLTPDNTFTGAVTISLASGPGTVGGTVTKNAVAGVATFGAIKLSEQGTYTLTASATGLTSGTSSSIVISGAGAYTWSAASGNWSSATSWTPNRTNPQTSDILVFDGNVQAAPAITADFITNQTVGSLSFINNVNATITTGNSTTIHTAQVGQNFYVANGSTLNLTTSAASVGLTIQVNTGGTGLVNGVITVAGSSATNLAKHVLQATDANGLTFGSGAKFIQGINMSASPFPTSGSASQIVFANGSSYYFEANLHGTSPQASQVLFEPQSTWYQNFSRPTVTTSPGDYLTMSGLTFPNFVVQADMWQENGFGSPVTFSNFIVNSGVNFNFWQNTKPGPTGSAGAWIINGNLTVEAGSTFNFGTGPYYQFNTGALTLNGPTHFISAPGAGVIDSISALTVNPGATLTLGSGLNIVIGTLVNNGTIIIQAGASLVQGTGYTATGTGNYIVEQVGSILPGLSGYNMWSSPIAASGFNFGWDDVNIYEYVETGAVRTASDYTTGWVSPFTAPAPYNTSTMLVGQGYILTGALNNAAFNGPNINNGNYSVPVTLTDINNSNKDGWNLLGNPYPSDIALTGANGFLSNLTNSLLISGGTVYFWSSSEGNYVATNGVTPGATTIPSCQGFFIEAVGNGSSIQFNNAMRQPSATSFYRQGADAVALLRITNPNGKTDATQIEFREGACDCYVKTEDAYKLKGNDTLEFYSKITTGNPYDFAINLLAPLELSKTVKLGYDAIVAGQYSIAIKDTVGFNGVSVYLLDNLLGSTYDLTKGSYQFTSGAVTEDTARFAVVFAPQSASVSGVTGVSSSTVSSTVNIYAYNKVVYVQNSVPTNVSISDITGRNVYQGNSTEINMSSATTGIYVVSVVNGNGVTTQKVVIQ